MDRCIMDCGWLHITKDWKAIYPSMLAKHSSTSAVAPSSVFQLCRWERVHRLSERVVGASPTQAYGDGRTRKRPHNTTVKAELAPVNTPTESYKHSSNLILVLLWSDLSLNIKVTLSHRCWERWDQLGLRDGTMTFCSNNTALGRRAKSTQLLGQLSEWEVYQHQWHMRVGVM